MYCSKRPPSPSSGPASVMLAGDDSDGDDEELASSAGPMTQNEEAEPILPLGEVSMDGADVVEVGSILSLLEADGTIVIRGAPGKPPLNEGSVLSAVAGSPEVRPSVCPSGGGAKEPLGRIHEIFGPCVLPHYTVRVEGAAAQHQLVARYQAAAKKLRQAEKTVETTDVMEADNGKPPASDGEEAGSGKPASAGAAAAEATAAATAGAAGAEATATAAAA
ncbi:unnamed protein product, partial [Laminaria digitata]